MSRWTSGARRALLAGIAVAVPAVATFLALRFLFRTLDAVLGPWIGSLIGRQIPGLGVIATLILLWLLGMIATHYLGARIIAVIEGLFSRVPLVRRIYSASKEVVESATLSKQGAFREVVMVEVPRRGTYSYGFVTSYTVRHDGETSIRLANVFIPNPPVPTSGALIAVPVGDLHYVDLEVEEALKLVLSGGMAAPGDLHSRPRE